MNRSRRCEAVELVDRGKSRVAFGPQSCGLPIVTLYTYSDGSPKWPSQRGAVLELQDRHPSLVEGEDGTELH